MLWDYPFEILSRSMVLHRTNQNLKQPRGFDDETVGRPKGLTVSTRAATSCIVSSTRSPDSHITDPRRLPFRGTIPTRYRNLPRVHFHIHDCTVTFARRLRWRSQRHCDVPSGFLNRQAEETSLATRHPAGRSSLHGCKAGISFSLSFSVFVSRSYLRLFLLSVFSHPQGS